ncbi:hypothetical protein [Actinoplanes sp. G11-F43]|uniref:hypothetical protein n=1 Tax=Actinoplanes sp. G11-F43 TaxID=3424130 RepID=UPI003D349F77
MTPHDDHSQQRQPLFYPVVIATVLLTIIGMVGGYLLAEVRDDQPRPFQTSDAGTDLIGGDPCRPETQRMGRRAGATGTLRMVLRVRTEKRTEAWICQDDAGAFYYHGNKGSAGSVWVEGKTALFLDSVTPDGNGGYQATASDGAVFTLDAERLLIMHADGRLEEQLVVPE